MSKWHATFTLEGGAPAAFQIVNEEFGTTRPVAECVGGGWVSEQLREHAHKLAAAPEMLEALREAFAELQTNDTVGTRARMLMHAAIAKAEGRS